MLTSSCVAQTKPDPNSPAENVLEPTEAERAERLVSQANNTDTSERNAPQPDIQKAPQKSPQFQRTPLPCRIFPVSSMMQ
jgi:hypothetical protein